MSAGKKLHNMDTLNSAFDANVTFELKLLPLSVQKFVYDKYIIGENFNVITKSVRIRQIEKQFLNVAVISPSCPPGVLP